MKKWKNQGLQAFLAELEKQGQLVRISRPISTVLEMTEIHKRVLTERGPVLLFEKPVLPNGKISPIPVVCNLFGTVERVAKGLGCAADRFQDFGRWLAAMKQPNLPGSIIGTLGRYGDIKAVLAMKPEILRTAAPVQDIVLKGKDIDLTALPVQSFWPGEPAPLITFNLVMTRPPESEDTADYNVGIYRMQVLGKDRLIARWLEHRGGARHFQRWKKLGKDMPLAVAIGADPATLLSGVMPLPDTISEYHFSGLIRKERLQLAPCKTVPILAPAHAEIVLEGYVSATETAMEGPYGDHTGYFNSVAPFPVFKVTAITMRRNPVYLSTYLGRPPDEASTMATALNDVFLPLLQQQFPEIVDCWLPPEACSYRIAVISIRKSYAGHARRIMLAFWSHLYQFSYTKMIIVVDEDIDVRNWTDVVWAVSTRMDPSRDLVVLENTPIDYLDFASPVSGLGGKLGIDATHKIGAETQRQWGRPLAMDEKTIRRVDNLWDEIFNITGIRRRKQEKTKA
jgi:4-hydroxy-3-polyprenylbenzoate decarboxylase